MPRTYIESIESRIVAEVDLDRFRKITNSTLEGLAKRSLNLSAIVGKSAEAKERRLVPEVVEDFFLLAGPMLGVHPKEIAKGSTVTELAGFRRTFGPLATCWNRDSASWAKNTSRSSLTRVTCRRTRQWSG